MYAINIADAKAHLSSLIKKVEENNEQIIIQRAGKPVAKIIRYHKAKTINRVGAFKNTIKLAKDFENWPDDIAKQLCIKD